MKASNARGSTKATKMRSQPSALVLSGVTVGTSEGLTVAVPGVGVTVVTVLVAVAAGLVADEWGATAGEPVKAKAASARMPSKTRMAANCNGFSESAGVTRYQWPSHIAVITPPSASAPAKKLPTISAPPRL